LLVNRCHFERPLYCLAFELLQLYRKLLPLVLELDGVTADRFGTLQLPDSLSEPSFRDVDIVPVPTERLLLLLLLLHDTAGTATRTKPTSD
jgi:hypothetical protein